MPIKAPNHDAVAEMGLPPDVRLLGVYPDYEGKPVTYVIVNENWTKQVQMSEGPAGILAAIAELRALDAQEPSHAP